MRAYLATLLMVAATVFAAEATAQNRPSSPRGEAATQISGKWIVVDYGRPILRGRTNIFGSGDAYGEAVNSGAPVWRAGANQTTKLSTEVDLMFGDAHLPAGDYTVFVDLKADGWTLIFSNHVAKENYSDEGDGLWGAYGYSPDKDAARVPMTMVEAPGSSDEFTIMFLDVTTSGGKIALWWEDQLATASFMTHDM